MELKEFIIMALSQISDGVSSAQKYLRESDSNAAVNPRIREWGSAEDRGIHIHDGTPVQEVDFDVAVTVTETSDVGVGGKINVAALGIETDRSTISQNTALNRIRFRVPIALPPHRTE